MRVHLVSDSVIRLREMRRQLTPYFVMTECLLGKDGEPKGDYRAIVVAANLRAVENVTRIRDIIRFRSNARKTIFIVDRNDDLAASQAYALGATSVLVTPTDSLQLSSLIDARMPFVASNDGQHHFVKAVASEAATGLVMMFAQVAAGRTIDVCSAKSSGARIIDSIAESGLAHWLDVVRNYYCGAFQHCLLVTGIAVDFGLSLGLSAYDLSRLYAAALFHDVGKAKLSLVLLNKSEKRDLSDRRAIESHPVLGFELLEGNEYITPEVLNAIRHHHEYLDGSGYPDGLCDHRIGDVVRMLTISDVFAELIEARSYKPPMPREDAYQVIAGMTGKLEKPLVKAFKQVALHR
jgi:putative nucleotidyltransferase with HDIG domain